MDVEVPRRRVAQQERSRAKVSAVLDAADTILGSAGAAALTTTEIARVAGVAVGTVYAYFPDREAIVVAVALRHWRSFADSVAAVPGPSDDPVGALADAMEAGFRAAPAFRALWFSDLRTDALRDATRPLRTEIAASADALFASSWPSMPAAERAVVARMVVLAGDGLLREAFRVDPDGDAETLAEARRMLRAYADARR